MLQHVEESLLVLDDLEAWEAVPAHVGGSVHDSVWHVTVEAQLTKYGLIDGGGQLAALVGVKCCNQH